MSYYKTHALDLLNNGYIPTPLIGKGGGMLKGWSQIDYDTDFVKELQSSHANHSIGLLTGIGITPLVAVDIDVYHPTVADTITNAFIDRFGPAPMRIGREPKRLLIYTTDREFTKIKIEFIDDAQITQAVEILGKGQQFVAFGIHPDTQREYQWVTEDSPLNTESFMLPEINLDELKEWLKTDLPSLLPRTWTLKKLSVSDKQNTDIDDFVIDSPKPPSDFTHEEIAEMLSFIDNKDMDHDTWVKIGMAIHHATNGTGFDLWTEWSKRSPKSTGKSWERKWKSFSSSSYNDASIGTIIYYAKQNGFSLKTPAVISDPTTLEKYTALITDSQNLDDLKSAAKQISSKNFDVFNLKTLIAEYRTKYKTITNLSLSESEAKAVLKFKKEKKSIAHSEVITKPEWLEGWYYVTDFDKFYSLGYENPISTKSFDLKFSPMMLPNENGGRPSASKMACAEYGCETVDTALYHPSQPETFYFEGRKAINTFKINTLPMEADAFTEEGLKAIEIVHNHIRKLCSNREDVTNNFIDWLAFNVKHIGVKINYSILLQGIEGVGKSFVKNLMTSVIGRNAREVSPQVVMGAFNEWAEGASFVAFEELRLQGHNRYDLLNNIKSAVSNNTVVIHRKGQTAYVIPNVTNYIALTNYTDAIPITSTDRRWMVVFAPWSSIQEFEADVGVNSPEYFDQLFGALNYGDELRKWLLEWKFSETFNPSGRAPDTEEKKAMIATSHSSDENDHIIAIIKEGGYGYNESIISVNHLKQAIKDYETAEELSGVHLSSKTPLHTTLKNLGYIKFEQIRWDNQRTVIWTKKAININIDTVKKMLADTVSEF